ncbi:terminase small subunit [Paenalcaligenes sp. Me131]|uniref:terminase small subunit n=1 Tax=Paenalcaligenes sp. Me131 TaxID=3392636 RepID=UPI003D29144B
MLPSFCGGVFDMEKETMALTAKQRRFVEEYLVDLNATQAGEVYKPKHSWFV